MRGWLLVLAAGAHSVHADNVSDAIALFDTGQKLFDAGKIDEACDAFSSSVRLDPQLGAKLNLANCRERQNRFADAVMLYEDVIAEAVRTKKPGRETFARQHLEAIRSKVARYKLRLGLPHPPGLVIKQIQGTGSVEIPEAQWSVSRLANAGAIVIEVSAPFRMTARVGGNLEPGKESEIVIPTLDIDATSAPAPHTDPTQPPVRPIIVEPRERSRRPLIIGSIGGGLVLASLGLGALAKSRYDEAVDEGSQSGVETARDNANLATLVALTGVICIGTAVALRWRERDKVIAPTATASSVGIAAMGRF
jgi:tetratricopeptide (TPR) repeat protein